MTKTNSKTTTKQHVAPPVKEAQQTQDLREQRLVAAALILSGMYANPCHGQRWYVSLFDWFKSRFGFRGKVASSMADYKDLSVHALKAADELIYHNENTPV